MQVIFVSRCEKQALKKTRKILDAFADRIGDNSWRTLITQNGLVAVKAMLRKQATKNTAVSCHWIRSNNQHELLFIVGQRHKFNPITGVAPVNTTKKNLLTMDEDHDWHYLPVIKSLTAIAALLHDWGKSTVLFQQKLVNGSKKSDPVRHEWISTILFIAFVKAHAKDSIDDKVWLEQLAKGNIDEQNITEKLKEMQSLDASYLQLPPIASIIAWLILSHHRLPINAAEKHRVECTEIKQLLAKITAKWGYDNTWQGGDQQQRLQDCFKFQHGLLTESFKWLKQLKRYAQKLLSQPQHEDLIKSINNGTIRVILHHARLALMLGDHNFSSEDPKPNHKVIENTLYANTDKKSKQLKQQLDEHLIGVCRAASCIATILPSLENKLPASANIKKLIETSPKDYQWQDKTYKDIKKHRHQENNQHNGCFVVNIASTGTGKTFANAKIMLALNPENKLRYSLALGLRTLTLQTGDEYKEKIKLDDSELATLIGSQTIEELHASAKEDNKPTTNEQLGSESAEELFDATFAEGFSDFPEIDTDIADHVKAKLTTTLRTDKQKKLLYSPVVVCTIDHLIQATENTKSQYILPSLRLMSSDLVIDEIDDFTGDDLVAISRLVFLAAMLGRKVVLSSATIPPDLAKNYFRVYQQGWLLYAKTRHDNKSIDCIWVDEFNTDIATIVSEDSETACKEYQQKHNKFIDKRLKKLVTQETKRKAKIIYVDNINHKYDTNKQNYYFQLIAETCQQLHQDYYGIDNKTELKVSFGLVRMANIVPAVALTKFLLDYQLEEHTEIRVMVYHSNQTLLLRSVQEKHLDAVLKTARKNTKDSQAIYKNKIIRNHLDHIHKAQPKTKNVLFILVSSPAIEVGRDHDYDWGIIDPSSARSITQTSGRISRHRNIICDKPNIAILQYNFKALKNNNPEIDICFIKPGYEDKKLKLKLNSHDLTKIIDIKQLEEKIDASWRISKPLDSKDRKPKENLAHLEHATTNMILRKVYSPKPNKTYKNDINGPNQINGYIDEAWYLTGCSQKFIPFRKQTGTQIKICLIYNAEGNKKNYFASYDNKGKLVMTDSNKPVESDITSKITEVILTEKQQQRLWLKLDFNQELTEYLNNHELTYNKYQYGDLTSYEYDQYQYCDQLGLAGIANKELEDC